MKSFHKWVLGGDAAANHHCSYSNQAIHKDKELKAQHPHFLTKETRTINGPQLPMSETIDGPI